MLTLLGVFYIEIMIRNKIYLIPNLLTTGSVLCGFVSIIYAFDGYLSIAANLIIASFVLDALMEELQELLRQQVSLEHSMIVCQMQFPSELHLQYFCINGF